MKCDSQYINGNRGGYKSDSKGRRQGRKTAVLKFLGWECVFLCVTGSHLLYEECGDKLYFQK